MSTFVAVSHNYLCLVILIFVRIVSSQQAGASCGSNPTYTFCWYNEMDLSSPFATSFTQNIFTELSSLAYLYAYFTPKNNDCLSPSLTVSYELIDNEAGNEYLRIYDSNDKYLIDCYNGKSCGSWYTCLNSYDLGYIKWIKDNSYYIKIYKTSYVDAECGHTLTANVHVTINCDKPPSPSPTPLPTPSPTIPTPSPSTEPTLSPTPKYFAMDLLSNSICNDFSLSTEALSSVSETVCIQYCQSLDIDQCRMVNYLDNFKAIDDSRCLIYNRPCSLSISDHLNNSRIFYKLYDDECTTYPSDWVDAVSDECQSYVDYGWCSNGVISNNRNVNDFLPLKKNGLTALDACCECGGGIQVINDDIGFISEPFAASYNETIYNALCSWDNKNNAKKQDIRKWDTFVAYQLCQEIHINNNANNNCSLFLDSQYTTLTTTSYVKFCDINDNTVIQEDDLYFIMIFIAETADNYIYVNLEWFDIDSFDLSSNIMIDTIDYSQCLTNLKTANNKMMGVYPCYFKYTQQPTLAPTADPTYQPSFDPTIRPSRSPMYSPPSHLSISTTIEVDTANNDLQVVLGLFIAIFHAINV